MFALKLDRERGMKLIQEICDWIILRERDSAWMRLKNAQIVTCLKGTRRV